jgi:hypothetical protein
MAESGPRARRYRDAARMLLHPKRLWREHRRWAIGLIAAVILDAGLVSGVSASGDTGGQARRRGDVSPLVQMLKTCHKASLAI